jgi:hypothetical protein
LRTRILGVLTLFSAGWAGAATITYTFSGDATGTAGYTSFSNEPFTISLTTDTSDIGSVTCCSSDLSTPASIASTVTIQGVGTGCFIDTDSVFVNPSEETIGIWHYNEPDWLDIVTSAALTYNLQTSIGPITPSAVFGNVQMKGGYMQSSLGSLAFSSVSDVTFSAAVANPQGTPGADPAPEPSTLALMGTGFVALAWRMRKRRA